jgi:hypothetical protein
LKTLIPNYSIRERVSIIREQIKQKKTSEYNTSEVPPIIALYAQKRENHSAFLDEQGAQKKAFTEEFWSKWEDAWGDVWEDRRGRR